MDFNDAEKFYVLEVLGELFKTDAKDAEMKAYLEFGTITRKDGQTVADFINQYDRFLNKIKMHGNVMSTNLLALKLMRAANLTNGQQQIIKASTAQIEYEEVKKTMKRTFGESTGISTNILKENLPDKPVKTEPALQASHRSCPYEYACCSCQENQH